MTDHGRAAVPLENAARETFDGHEVVRIRVGIGLWLLSWIPFGLIFHLKGWAFVAAILIEVAIGLIGLAIAGSVVAQSTKNVGWRLGLRNAWHLFRSRKP